MIIGKAKRTQARPAGVFRDVKKDYTEYMVGTILDVRLIHGLRNAKVD